MARVTKVFNDFSGGDWGDRGATKADLNQFKASNLMVLRNGMLCPRPGVVSYAHTGLPTGEVSGFGYLPLGAIDEGLLNVYFIIGTEFWRVDGAAVSAASENATALAAPLDRNHLPQETIQVVNQLYLAMPGSGIYRYTLGTDSLTLIKDHDDVVDLTLGDERLYAAGERNIYYSDIDDFDTWGDDSFTTVGVAHSATAIVDNGYGFDLFRGNDCYWQLSGDPADETSFRALNPYSEKGPGATSIWYDRDGHAIWIPQIRLAPIVLNRGIVDTKELERFMAWTGDAGDIGCAYISVYEDLVFTSGFDDRGLARLNDVWVELDFEVSVSKFISRFSSYNFVLCDGGGVGVAPTFYRWEPNLERPAFVSDTACGPGDDSDTPLDAWVHFPEIVLDNDKVGAVQSVEVEFLSWNTGTAETAHFDVAVRTMNPTGEGVTTILDSETETFDEAVASSSTTGTEQRISFDFGEQGIGRRHQVRITNIRSVTIREVTVVLDDETRVSC
jgi:hypothetical protein